VVFRNLFSNLFFYTRARGPARTHRAILLAVWIVLVAGIAVGLAKPAQTNAATSNTINFQARLESSAGAIVADGTYNVEFDLYYGCTNEPTSNAGCTLDWTEDYLNSASSGVSVANGYLTANLGGSAAPFSGINWDQQQWMTMDIGGTGSSITVPYATSPTGWDGPMSPALQLTAVPYAFRAGQLAVQTGSNESTLGWTTQTAANNLLLPNEGGTLCVDSDTAGCGFAPGSSTSYVQNTSALQSGTTNFNISGSGAIGTTLTVTGAINGLTLNTTSLSAAAGLSISSGGTSSLSLDTAGSAGITIGTTHATSLAFGSTGNNASTVFNQTASATGFIVQNATGAVFTVDTSSNNQVILGKSSTVNGQLEFANITNSNVIKLLSGTTASTYSLTLPTTIAADSNDCLQLGTVSGSGPYSAALGFATCSGGSGVTSIGTFDTYSGVSNGATISGTSLFLQSASITNPGLVNANTSTIQSFAGAKQFIGAVTLSSSGTGLTVTNSATIGTGLTVSAGGALVTGNSTITGNLTISTGNVAISNTSSAIQAFQVQNASSQNVLQLDTLNNDLTVGSIYSTLPNLATGGGTVSTSFANTTGLGVLPSTCGAAYTASSDVMVVNSSFPYGEIINFGGWNGTSSSYNTVCYAVLNSSGGINSSGWQSTTSMLAALYNASAVVYNGYVYVIGGTIVGSDQDQIYSAPLNSAGGVGSWGSSAVSYLPVGSNGLEQATAQVYNGYVYVMGGSSSSVVQSTVYYTKLGNNGTVGSWYTTNSLPTPTAGGFSFVNNGYIYEGGGGSSATTCNVSTYSAVYYATINANGTIGPWITTTAFPSIYAKYSSAVTWGGYAYVLQGTHANVGCAVSGAGLDYAAQLNSNGTIAAWTNLNASAPGSDYFQTAATVVNGYIYTVGGTSTGSNAKTAVYYGQVSGTQATTGSGGQSYNVSINGAEDVQTAVNSSSALVVQNSNGSSVLTVDTANTDVTTNGQLSVNGGLVVSGLAVPTLSSVASTGINNGITYQYEVSAVNYNGNYTAGSTALSNGGLGASTLTTSNYNTITWTGVSGASQYYVYRVYESGGTETPGFVGTVQSNAGSNNIYTFYDNGTTMVTYTNGATSSSSPAPQYDTSGQLTATGTVLLQNANNSTSAFLLQTALLQNSPSQTLVQVDTTGNNISVGDSSGGLNSWQTNTNNLPTALSNVSSASYNGYTYVVGGGQTTVYLAQLNANGSTGSWQTNTNALPASLYNPSVVTNNGYIYVIGGNTSGGASQSTVYYAQLTSSGQTGAWQTNTNALPSALSYTTAVTNNGYIYVMGGATSTSATPSTTIYYAALNANGSTGSWQTNSSNPLPVGLNYATSTVYNGYVYILGGDSTSATTDSTPKSTVYYAALTTTGATGTWTSETTLPHVIESASSAIENGYLYLIGGDTSGGDANSSYVVYETPISNINGSIGSWGTDTQMNLPQAVESAGSSIYNGYIYIIGGSNSSGSLSLSSVYYTNTGAINIQSQANFATGLSSYGAFTADAQANFLQYTGFAQSVGIGGNLTVGGSTLHTGTVTVETSSTTAFQIENSSASSLLIADTTNQDVGIGLTPASGDAALQVEGSIDIDGSGAALKINGTIVCSNTAGAGSTSGCSGSGSGSSGYIQSQTTSAQTANFYIQNTVGSTNIIKAAASGTSDLLDLDNSSATKVAYFDNVGDLTLANNLTVNGTSTHNGNTTVSTTSSTAFVIQNTGASETLLTANTSTYIITIAGTTSTFGTLALNNAHFESLQTTAPTIGTISSNCGSSATASITTGSTDSAGSLTINASGTQALGCTAVITFNKAYATAPKSVMLTPANQATANTTTTGLYAGVSATSTTTFTIDLGAKATSGTAYQYYYWVIE
jgi:N-acetylneuraminic acid mutarotase